MAVSRSVVETRPYVSAVLLPQATILTLCLSGLIVKTPFEGSSTSCCPVARASRRSSSFFSEEMAVTVPVFFNLSSSVLPAFIHFHHRLLADFALPYCLTQTVQMHPRHRHWSVGIVVSKPSSLRAPTTWLCHQDDGSFPRNPFTHVRQWIGLIPSSQKQLKQKKHI